MSDLHNPEHTPGFRGDHSPGSFLDKRDLRPVLTSHERNTAGNCRTCGTPYPCLVRTTGHDWPQCNGAGRIVCPTCCATKAVSA